jgi:GGDEF domain-containing protein
MKAWGDLPRRRIDDHEIRWLTDPGQGGDDRSPIDAGPTARRRPSRTPARGLGTATPDPTLDAIPRARAALLALGDGIDARELRDPIVAAAYLDALRRGTPVNLARLLDGFDRRMVRGAKGREDFPWVWPPDGQIGSPLYARFDGVDVNWRPRESSLREDDPAAYARRLVEPIAEVQTLELLAELAARNGPLGDATEPFLARLLPIVEARFALFVAGDDPWRDTFALWQLSHAPRLLERIWYLAIAIAYRYASMARRVAGPVIGTGIFDGEPLVSASAALGRVLWQLRIYPSLVPELIRFIADARRPDGGWGDPGQPSDVLTTLVAADFLLGLDAGFDPARTIRWLEQNQEPEGWWRALGPEVPWLTASIADLLERAGTPFGGRYDWPGALKLDLDRRTQLPTFAWFSDLARGVQELPGLAKLEWDIAFIDLAGFGAFNTEFGQAKGDDVIGAFGRALTGIPLSRAIRDGGDEFVVVGTPGADGLEERLEVFRQAWLRAFREAFGDIRPPVRPRILVTRTVGRDLAHARELLGRDIGPFKKVAANQDPPDDGVIARL